MRACISVPHVSFVRGPEARLGAREKKALFILIDACRYDTVANPKAASYLFPNLAEIADHGFLRRVVANAQGTQFVMPSLFSQTYPLDHGGYNTGIRDRSRSFPRCSRPQAGKPTGLRRPTNWAPTMAMNGDLILSARPSIFAAPWSTIWTGWYAMTSTCGAAENDPKPSRSYISEKISGSCSPRSTRCRSHPTNPFGHPRLCE